MLKSQIPIGRSYESTFKEVTSHLSSIHHIYVITLSSRFQCLIAGRAATEAVATKLLKLAPGKLKADAPVPPAAVSQRAHLLISSRRAPHYIGGRYRKLKR